MIRHPIYRAVPLLVASLLLAACAGMAPKDPATRFKNSMDVLQQRADQRWEYLVTHEAAKAWQYLTPGYRATMPQDEYATMMNHRPVTWTGAKVEKVKCSAVDSCTVQMGISYKLPIPRTGGKEATATAHVAETWLLLDNQWYHLPDEAGG